MALNLVLFQPQPVTVLTVKKAPKFLARLTASDLSKLAVGSLERTVMLNASGGIIGTVIAVRTETDTYELFLYGDKADVREAWIRQVSAAFDAEIEGRHLCGFLYAGEMPVDAAKTTPNTAKEESEISFLNLRWIQLVTGPEANIKALHENLTAAGAQAGAQEGLDALRILSDPERIFIGRALTEARFKAGGYDRMHLVAFETAFDPALLVDVPMIVMGDTGYQLTSIARIPEIPLTAGLVRLPYTVNVGEHDPRSYCEKALVVDAQV